MAIMFYVWASVTQKILYTLALPSITLPFQIELTRGYDYSAFREDLKKLYDYAGIQGENTVFLFSDTQIVVEEFLEDINNILNSGEVNFHLSFLAYVVLYKIVH